MHMQPTTFYINASVSLIMILITKFVSYDYIKLNKHNLTYNFYVLRQCNIKTAMNYTNPSSAIHASNRKRIACTLSLRSQSEMWSVFRSSFRQTCGVDT